ncbi:MAG: XdhC family protein [Actinobacteria bacterium]|nr:XdhC family protein [Actinomycetota bacterium]
MKELLSDLERWRRADEPVVLARVVELEGSGPRLPGAAMAVNASGEVTGSVSGGCVEGAVVAEALDLLAAPGARATLSTFGYSDDQAFEVGLTCGGTVHLFLERLAFDDVYDAARELIEAGGAVGLLTVIDGPAVGSKAVITPDGLAAGSLGTDDLDRVAVRDARGELASGQNAIRHYGECGEAGESTVTVFVESFAPLPRLVIFGAVDFTAALSRAGKMLGYHVVVCDAREVFATARRFPMADEVVVDWPHRYLEHLRDGAAPLGPRDAVCVLTHDHKFDVPAIVAALQTGVGYLGAMGSRRTHAERVEKLRAEGVTDEQLARVMAPIGLDLGARTPEETAIAICAEILARRTGRPAPSLKDGAGPIH